MYRNKCFQKLRGKSLNQNVTSQKRIPALLGPTLCYCGKMLRVSIIRHSTFLASLISTRFTIQPSNKKLLLNSGLYNIWSISLLSTVFTDNNPLTFYVECKTHNQQLIQWALVAQRYNITIQNKNGSENVIADTLPRV